VVKLKILPELMYKVFCNSCDAEKNEVKLISINGEIKVVVDCERDIRECPVFDRSER